MKSGQMDEQFISGRIYGKIVGRTENRVKRSRRAVMSICR